jgi:hypothetical protein
MELAAGRTNMESLQPFNDTYHTLTGGRVKRTARPEEDFK